MRGKKLKLSLLCVVVLLFGCACAAFGDWDEGDGHKMHYPQLPKLGGWDVAFQFGRLADDWQCSQTGPVEDIHFWVSWEMDMVGSIGGFSVRIWSDDPCGTNGYSEPNELLWERDFDVDEFTVRDMPDDLQGWFDPWTGFWVYPDHISWQQINIEDINEPFIQQQGEIYWLEIDMWGAPNCGWKESGSPQFRDDAVYWASGWYELIDPEIYESMDLAFVITGKEEVVKWEQPPCLDDPMLCMDVDATDDDWMTYAPQALADDFNCTTTGLITDIHIWGSWLYDEPPYFDPNHVWFTLCLYSNDPCGPMGWSEPNELLWTKEFHEGDFDVEIFAQGFEAYYIPCELEYLPDSDFTCWLYSFYIDPCEAFVQEEGTIYWLALQAHIYDPLMEWGRFGWKNSSEQWNDDAVWTVGWLPDNLGPWQELRHPMTEESVDLAFKITTVEEEEPKPLVSHSKWSQPPIEIDPNSAIPTYCGWDELSYTDDPCCEYGAGWQVVADDYRCIGSMPVTSIHWWGSYVGWEEPIPPVPEPVAWRIGFWSNVQPPPDADPNYSYPNELLWQIQVDADRVDVNNVGQDYFPEPYSSDTCFQYYVDLEPNEVFWQDDFDANTTDNIFWLSIAAIYPQESTPSYPWGWKTRPWSWMDDAVTFGCPILEQGMVLGPMDVTPIKDPVHLESYDVAFELDTDPNYIKWEQLYTGIRHWPHYEDEESMYNWVTPGSERMVFDDWRCLRRTPVTAIVWWGSYIGYGYEACSEGPFMELPVPPDYFVLEISTDSPAGSDPCYPFSHPNEPIWDYVASEYDEVLVGYDKHPLGGPNEPVFRYSVRLPEDMWFHQPDYNGVFWLSVHAAYVFGDSEPNYDWGWTNHEHVFNDNAVAYYYDSASDEWVWEELYDQTGASEDMSFILFTDPNLCSTCANYNCDSIVNFFDYADFADDWRWAGPAGGYNNSDLDCNGIVDFKDLGIFCMQWLDSCP